MARRTRRVQSAIVCLTAVVVLIFQGTEIAHAQSGRPDTRNMTCSQAQALVKQRGSVVLTTGPNTFDKFVADARYCLPQSNSVRAKFAPTKDDPKCPVGNRCFQNRDRR
ncbi:hypothetical protein LP7551_00840 [Roseibium album]|nr:hypothetical protein LP7551_00840 [Roseibium album]